MDTFLLVVCVKEAKNIPIDVTNSSSTLILEARFHDEILASDPINLPLTPGGGDQHIDISAELAWILSRKSLHESKIKRVPIKLQVFLYNSKYQEKKFIGYHIFDVRCVQETVEPKFEWKPLLNSKYKGSSTRRPEINCALQVTRDDINLNQYTSLNHLEPCSKLIADLQVKETGDTFKIWDANKFNEDQCNEKYLLSVIIATVSNNLDQFCTKVNCKEGANAPYSFQYTLFGKAFYTKHFYFDQPNFPVERISFKIASTGLEDLKTYFDLNPMMEIQLCNSNNQSSIPLAFTSLFLKSLFTDVKFTPIIGEFLLQPLDESIDDYPQVSVGVCIELEQIYNDQSPGNGVNGSSSFTKSHSVKSFNGTSDPDDIHHYCFSIDLRSISPTNDDLLSKEEYFIQFSYAIFGQVEKIKTSPIQLTSIDKKGVTFKDGYFAFNFASSWNQLATSLSNVPLIFELVQVQSSKLVIRGLCKLPLKDIIESQADLENKKLIVKKPSIVDPREEELAVLNCILCLQDLGVVDVESTSLATLDLSVLHEHLTSPLSKSHSKEACILEKLFIDAAVEIELWKQIQIQKFTQKLSSKNTSSQNNFKSLNNGNGGTNGSSNFLNELDDSHPKQIIEILKMREAEIEAKEIELKKANETCKQRYDQLQDEISTAIDEIKAVYEEKLSKERITIQKLEEQNRKLSDEIVALKSQVKSPSRTSSLVRINSVPSSVRSASKA